MNKIWEKNFQGRIRSFEIIRPSKRGEVAISIKVRVVSGCFHREHSPNAYNLIDKHLSLLRQEKLNFVYEEHESGPEIITYVAAGIAFTASIINLIVAIIKARSDGIRKGDRPADPIELIVRKTSKKGKIIEERIMRFGFSDVTNADVIKKCLNNALPSLIENADPKTSDIGHKHYVNKKPSKKSNIRNGRRKELKPQRKEVKAKNDKN